MIRIVFLISTLLLHTCFSLPFPVERIPAWAFGGTKTSVTDASARDESVRTLIRECRKLGQVGSIKSEQEREKLVDLATELKKYSIKNPARYPLSGIHDLVYSAAPGGSSGKVGPFVGKVTQEFVDESTFINAVELGPVKIALRAQREVKSNDKIKVTFTQTTISLFGQTVKQIDASGGGVWKVLFCGEVDGKLVRVMETPSLFVIEKPL